MRRYWLPLCMTTVILSGCETAHTPPVVTMPLEMTFPALWKTYLRCQSRSDPYEMWSEAQELHKAVRAIKQRALTSRLLPATIEQTLAEPPPRLAVDPQAMTAACALLAGRTAKEAGNVALSENVFRFVRSHFSHARYAYYVTQARLELEQNDRIRYEPVLIASDRDTRGRGAASSKRTVSDSSPPGNQ
jgi:hypothetical protein